MTTIAAPAPILSDDLLLQFRERAPVYDRENRFFQEDFDDLRNAGYLTLAVPRELGGHGGTIADVVREQKRLAYYAAPTALATNMHLYWTGVAADLWRAGDTSLEWLLKEAAAGEVFAAGHAEHGEDFPLLMSTTQAQRVDGGYRFTGHKSFGSLTPVWTRLGLHGMDTSDPAAPKVVHAFMPRSTKGYRIEETWDVMGMRATRSDDTILDGALVPDRYIARIVPAGAAGIDPFVLNIFAWALCGFSAIYAGLARRALDITIERATTTSKAFWERPVSHHPEIQHGVAKMVIDLEGLDAHLDRVAADWVAGMDYGLAWGVKLVAAKSHTVEAAWRIVDTAMDLAGGWGMHKSNELERLFRDARAGRFHPTNSLITHELIGKLTLGIDPDAQPRWG